MTGTDLATTGGPAPDTLAIVDTQAGWTDAQIAVIRQIGTQKATAADLDLFFHVCRQTGLDPFLRQIYLVEYGGKPTIQTGIDGFRVVARRAADRGGESLEYEDTQWCGPDGVWSDVWLQPGPPAAARAVVLRNGKRFAHVALYAEYAGTKNLYESRGGKNVKVGEEINSMWTGKAAHMIGKCAEAGALRKAYPQDLGGVYIAEERPTIAGEVVREDTPADPRLGAALALVDAATTNEELAGVWQAYQETLGVADRAALSKAIKESPVFGVHSAPTTQEDEQSTSDIIEGSTDA